MKHRRRLARLRAEWFLGVTLLSCLVLLTSHHEVMHVLNNPFGLAAVLAWLFIAVLGSSLAVVRHADRLAARLGEPYGTLILTLSITSIEVMSISAVMLRGDNNPTLARDTLFAVVMIVLNLMVGMSLLIGAWRHREQHYNLQGANIYIGAIIPLVVLSLVLPDFTQTTAGPTLSFMQQSFLVVISVGLYGFFLTLQASRHKGYFMSPGDAVDLASGRHLAHPLLHRTVLPHALLLVAYLIPVVYLAHHFAHPVNYLIETTHAPVAFAGVIIAILVATPEAISAVRAAAKNHLQHSINIVLGSILSTIGLTVPAIIIVSEVIGRPIVLGVEHADLVMLLLTLAVSIVTFSSGRTNVMQGAVHLILFAAYLMLIVQG